MIIKISNKNITIINMEGPTGVRGRNSDNKLYSKYMNWEPSQPLFLGLQKTYYWINEQVNG